MPNLVAIAALVLWPAVSLALFLRLPPGRAVVASLVVAYLFLPPPPAGFDFPLLPPLTKETIPSLTTFVFCLILWRDRVTIWPQSPVLRILALVYLLGPFATVLTNAEPVYFGRFGLPGLSLKEAFGILIQQALLLLPFVMAQSLLSRQEDIRDLLFALVVGGLVYSVPMLAEVRLSPQLNTWIYGYFQHDFSQMIRFGGYRPIVFLYHALWVAFFTLSALLSAVALMRDGEGRRAVGFGAAAIWLAAVLVLCKSVASLLYGLVLAPLVLFAAPRAQLVAALLMGALAIGYPVAKGLHLVPQAAMLEAAEDIDPDRAASLRFRFLNEEILLDRAYEKPFFGWGLWGRNQIHDPDTGEIETVSDGRWIIIIGVFGWLGFLAEFGLLVMPVVLVTAAFFRRDGPVPVVVSAACLILAINVIDLIPNATITPLTWLFAGALTGFAERVLAERHGRTRHGAAPAFPTVL